MFAMNVGCKIVSAFGFPRLVLSKPSFLAVAGVLAALLPAVSGADTVEYYHLDALGSVRAVTNQSGNVVERHDYLPFGQECAVGACAGNTPTGQGQPRRFTGKERDVATGLDYFGARYYESKIGRFTTVDPVQTTAENLVDPQRWNRYAYARNNPLRYTDPDGKVIAPVIIVGVAIYALLSAPDIANAPGPNDPTYSSDQSAQMFSQTAKGLALAMGVDYLWPARVLPNDTAERAKQVHGALDPIAQEMRTTAVGAVKNADGSTGILVGSSRPTLSPSQRAALRPGETPVRGPGHAEKTVLDAAAAKGQRVTRMGVSRKPCEDCGKALRDAGVKVEH